jgi:hypothetical protein
MREGKKNIGGRKGRLEEEKRGWKKKREDIHARKKRGWKRKVGEDQRGKKIRDGRGKE